MTKGFREGGMGCIPPFMYQFIIALNVFENYPPRLGRLTGPPPPELPLPLEPLLEPLLLEELLLDGGVYVLFGRLSELLELLNTLLLVLPDLLELL